LALKSILGISVVEISKYGHQRPGIDLCFVDIGPSDFLGLFQNADCVCTNSYHGLLFSLINNIPCYLHTGKRWNQRSQHMLKLIDQFDKSIVDQNINSENYKDYCIMLTEYAQKVLNEEKNKALDYLTMLLGEACNG